MFCAVEIDKAQKVTGSTFKLVMYTCLRDVKPPEGEPDRGACLRGVKPPEGEPDRGVRSPEQCDTKTTLTTKSFHECLNVQTNKSV